MRPRPRIDKGAFHFLPLGGTGEIGMNLNAYQCQGRWLLVDCGVMFERCGPHTSDALYPDVSFLLDHVDQIEGLVLTHIHQDHLGAVRDLWPLLRCPVYCTRFAKEMLHGPLKEVGIQDKVPIKVLDERCRLRLGPFDLQRIPLTHSTVEMGALVIRTPHGTVLHTGDWKLDPNPIVGRKSDRAALETLSLETIHAVVSDSTNAMEPGWSGSEGDLVQPLVELVRSKSKRVAVTLFSSNVARLHTLAQVAHATGRQLVPLGRSLLRTLEAAQAAGYLEDLPPIVPLRDYGYIPRHSVLIVCTGSQGEPRAALTRIAADTFRDVYLEGGDTVIYSARRIPGCEADIDRVRRMLREKGVEVVTAGDADVHVSGHPCQDELRALYDWVRPKAVIPVHGTPSHLRAHAGLARSMGIPAHQILNGDVLRIGETIEHVGVVETGRVRRQQPRPDHRRRRRNHWGRRR